MTTQTQLDVTRYMPATLRREPEPIKAGMQCETYSVYCPSCKATVYADATFKDPPDDDELACPCGETLTLDDAPEWDVLEDPTAYVRKARERDAALRQLARVRSILPYLTATAGTIADPFRRASVMAHVDAIREVLE